MRKLLNFSVLMVLLPLLLSANLSAQETVIQDEFVTEQSFENTDVITQSDSKVVTYTVLALIVVLLVAHIVAIVKTRKGQMYAFANWWDFILVIVAGIASAMSVYFYLNNATNSATFWIALSVGVLSFAGTIFLSIKINSGNALSIILSILAKMFVFVAIGLIIVIWLLGDIIKSAGKDKVKSGSFDSMDLDFIEYGGKAKKASGWLASVLLVSLIAVQWKMPQRIEK